MDILAGPTCQNGWVWWEIRSLTTGLTGWTAEGDGQNYWLLPVSTSTPSVSNHPHLAFASDRDGSMHIYLMDTNNPGNYIPLPIPPGYNWSWWPSFCGDRIATEVQDTSPTKKPQWVYLLDPVNGTSERLNISEDADMLGVPRCSPDGKYIAYSIHQNNVWGMSIAELSGSQAIAIASLDALGYTSWPKTNYDFFFMDKSKNFSIKKVANFPASGVTETQEILSNAKYPAISPDGNSLAYACESVTKLCVRNLRTNQTTPLAPLNYTKVGDRQMPATAMWSSDGRWIYYSSADSGKWDILRIHPDGSGLENITSSWSSNELAPALQW
jgi:Tol biopolymer transport system component